MPWTAMSLVPTIVNEDFYTLVQEEYWPRDCGIPSRNYPFGCMFNPSLACAHCLSYCFPNFQPQTRVDVNWNIRVDVDQLTLRFNAIVDYNCPAPDPQGLCWITKGPSGRIRFAALSYSAFHSIMF